MVLAVRVPTKGLPQQSSATCITLGWEVKTVQQMKARAPSGCELPEGPCRTGLKRADHGGSHSRCRGGGKACPCTASSAPYPEDAPSQRQPGRFRRWQTVASGLWVKE